jgi:mannitol-1-phosphate 5-dehydrogenase
MDDQGILIFGAGKIGRSFIGQLFATYGYALVFVDVDRSLVEELNRRGEYPVAIKGTDYQERLVIRGVRAIHASEQGRVAEALAMTTLAATSVGKTALPALAPLVAMGLQERERQRPGSVLDLILAENMRGAAGFFREKLRAALPAEYPLEKRLGLVETSIGKMVPIVTIEELKEDPLLVSCEPYNTLILDRKGFLGPIPKIPELSLKENMKAWVDRKAFVHNLGHATAAFAGHLKYPGARFLYEVLEDPEILDFTRSVMAESAKVLEAAYPGEFPSGELLLHIDDLLARFRNRNLGDTLFRVGSDLNRKLGEGDRFMDAIRLAEKHGAEYQLILKAMAMGFSFRVPDENGRKLPGDVTFLERFKSDPEKLLEEVCGLTPGRDNRLIDSLLYYAGIHP